MNSQQRVLFSEKFQTLDDILHKTLFKHENPYTKQLLESLFLTQAQLCPLPFLFVGGDFLFTSQ